MVRENSRAAPQGFALETLEPYDGKLSRTVLRGERGCKASDLPDDFQICHMQSVLIVVNHSIYLFAKT